MNFISDSRISLKVCALPLSIKLLLKFELFSSRGFVSEEFFRRILKASPLTNPFFVCTGRFPFA